MSQYAVLVQLSAGDGLTNADLARGAFITAQSMQGVLTNLERAGLIERKADAGHGRRQPARLTARGSRALRAAQAAVTTVERRLAAAVAPLDASDVAAMLNRIERAFPIA